MSDDADHARQLEEWERGLRLGVVLAKPAEPPRRLAEPDCEACGDPIEPERLAAMPHARRCVFCQAERERRQALFCRG